MEAEILHQRGRYVARILRKHTRRLRFLLRLIFLRLRLWFTVIFPFKTPLLYQEYPADAWLGSTAKGQDLMQGKFCDEMGSIDFKDDFWKAAAELPNNSHRKLQEFQWLRHLNTYENKNKAAEFARKLLGEWHNSIGCEHPLSQANSTRAERLVLCYCYHDLLIHGAPLSWIQQQELFYLREILHLADVMRLQGERTGLSVLKALAFSSMQVPSMQFLLRPTQRMLRGATKRRFKDDGGHVSRSPEIHRWDMSVLLEIRAAMKQRHIPISPQFDELLQRGLDALASFTHGDHKLACFHGTIEHPVEQMMNLWQVWRKPKPMPQKTLPNSGFVHLREGESTLILDAGYNPKLSPKNFASPLAFEFSRRGARMISNCGDYRGKEQQWNKIVPRTAAHSTFSIDHYDTWENLPDWGEFKSGHCAVEETDHGLTISADHYGYADKLGYILERHIELVEKGNVLKGTDTVHIAPKTMAYIHENPQKMAIRFHLHPSISVEKMTPQSVQLKLKNGEYWEFIPEGSFLAPLVEESIYLGENGLPQPTTQLVIRAHLEDVTDEQSFSWKFQLTQ